MYNLMDDILEHSIVLADALKRNWSIEILFLKNNHHMRYKYVVPVFIDYEKQIVQLQRFDERIFDINIKDIVFCEVMIWEYIHLMILNIEIIDYITFLTIILTITLKESLDNCQERRKNKTSETAI